MSTNCVIENSMLAGDISQTESLLSSLAIGKTRQLILDFQKVTFVKPYGLLALWIMARQAALRDSAPIKFTNVPDHVLAHLERMEFFNQVGSWVQSRELPEEARWSRTSQSDSLLEMTQIATETDIFEAMQQLQHVCKQMGIPNTAVLLNVISELCSNIYYHSGDENGCTFVQRYQSFRYGWQKMSVIVGDMGQGIEGSLRARSTEIGDRPIDFLRAVLEGMTSRTTGRGGMGLRTVQELAVKNRGRLWLRSDTAGVLVKPEAIKIFDDLYPIVGTQLLVELRTTL